MTPYTVSTPRSPRFVIVIVASVISDSLQRCRGLPEGRACVHFSLASLRARSDHAYRIIKRPFPPPAAPAGARARGWPARPTLPAWRRPCPGGPEAPHSSGPPAPHSPGRTGLETAPALCRREGLMLGMVAASLAAHLARTVGPSSAIVAGHCHYATAIHGHRLLTVP